MVTKLSFIRFSAILAVIGCTMQIDLATATPFARHLFAGWKTNTAKRSIDLATLTSGGVPKDGIPALDRPRFVSAQTASRWLKPVEPVIALSVSGVSRAYPLQILVWHEIVNDHIARVPVVVTFCPLCNSAIVFERTVGNHILMFGVSGMLRHSDLVMYDRQSESLWQQITGRAIVGDMTGAVLKRRVAQIVSFKQFRTSYPTGRVLSRRTGFRKPYGRNPYAGNDRIHSGRSEMSNGRFDKIPPRERLIGVSLKGLDKAYPYSVTGRLRVINDVLADVPIAVFHISGAVSALDSPLIPTSRMIGSTGVFDRRLNGRILTFRFADGRIYDMQTESTWDVTGKAKDGPLAGRQLDALPHGDYFAFAWLAFKPNIEVFQPENAADSALAPSPDPGG